MRNVLNGEGSKEEILKAYEFTAAGSEVYLIVHGK